MLMSLPLTPCRTTLQHQPRKTEGIYVKYVSFRRHFRFVNRQYADSAN